MPHAVTALRSLLALTSSQARPVATLAAASGNRAVPTFAGCAWPSSTRAASRRIFGYRLRRLASLGLWRPLKQFDARTDGIVDIALGFGGVLVRPEFFTQRSFDIPDVLWTVDDIWLSGNLAVNGITVRQASDVRLSANAQAADMSALLDVEIEGHGRDAANQKCVDYFRAKYGIWPA